MRKLVLVSLTVLSATVAFSPAAFGAGAKSVKCGGGSSTFLFWPRGHQQIPSVNFGNYPIPHLEAYKTVAGFPNSAFRAFMDSQGNISPAKSCKSVPAGAAGAIKHLKSTTSAGQLVCKLSGKTRYIMSPGDFTVIDGGKVVDATILPQGSKMSWDSKKCSLKPPPS
jgi:hypothetical protein